MQDIKFFYQPYQNKKFWSNKSHKYYTSNNIQDQVWDSPEQPCKGECLFLHEIILRLPKNAIKSTRSAIMRFPTDVFPLKEYIGYDKWNGVIFIDLDLIKSSSFCKKINAIVENDKLVSYDKERMDKFYSIFKSILYNICPENFYYIERSSSYVGVHIMFYFDIEKTRDNFFRCTEYCKKLLSTEISKNGITDFDQIITEKSVFDSIYNRIYQKCYITGIDAYINDFVSGNIDIELINKYEIKQEIVNEVKSNYSYNINLSKIKDNIYNTDHNIRFYIYTALKKVTKSKNECNSIWVELCKKFKLYKDYTYNRFVNEFNYESIDASTAHINILERYGFDIKTGETYFHLNDNQYLGNIQTDLLNSVVTGINFWRAPTGSGKTVFWTNLNKENLNDILNINMKKPILIVEPLNSIIDTKYNNDIIVVTGSKQFPKSMDKYSMYVTNYNKLLKKTGIDKFELRPDIEEFFCNFEYIVIDESHIIIKDSFRCDVLIPFIHTLQNVSKYCKVILQTASPMDEDLLFNIKNKIIITKKLKAEIKYITRIVDDDKFSIQYLTDITKYYISQNRKVYIYWNNASLTQLNSFKNTYDDPEKVAIYHKRNKGEKSMERISKYHLLEKHDIEDYNYNILLSSVYFGVGNDLDDECRAATIIVGDNPVQEDIQAIGRWRNSTDIEVCQVILPHELDFIKNTKNERINRNRLLVEERLRLKKMWHDKNCKDKSIVIYNQTYKIKEKNDIEVLAIMKSAETYYSAFSTKIDILEDPYYNIRCKHDIDRKLEVNTDLNEQTKDYWKSIKDIRNSIKKDILLDKIDYDNINTDSNIEKFYRLWNKLKIYNLDKVIPPQYICSNANYNKLNIWVHYYRGLRGNNIDYAELYSILWYVKWYDGQTEEIIKKEIKIFNKEISIGDYYKILAYVIFVHNKNKFDNSYRILFNYFGKFKWYCKLFTQLPKPLIDMFYDTGKEIDMSPTNIFFDTYGVKDINFENIIISCLDDIKKQTEHMDKTKQEIIGVIKGCLFFVNNQRKEAGRKGGEKCKRIRITDKFKHPEKYKLEIGQEFDSCISLSEYTKKSIQSVSSWLKKGWIIEVKSLTKQK